MSTDFPKLSLDEILNGRKAAQGSVPICMRLDVMADIEELERRILQLKQDTDDPRMAAGNEESAVELADQIRALEDEAQRYTIDLRLQAIDRDEWHEKVDQFTVRDVEAGTAQLDLAALVTDIFPKSLISPEMSPGQRDDFLAKLSEAQWESVMQKVFDLNRRTVTVGKSLTASFVTRPKSAKPEPAGQ